MAGLDEAKAELDDDYAMLARAVPPPELDAPRPKWWPGRWSRCMTTSTPPWP